MARNVLLALGTKLVETFWQSCDVKHFVVHLLEKYAASTDNDVDDALVKIVSGRLLVNCPEA
jgi:hypothetical protein